LDLSNDSYKRNLSVIREAHDWEVDVFASFFNLLHSFRMRQEGEDKLRWVPSKRRKFDVRLFYNILIAHDSTPFPWKSIGGLRPP
jgi:hypothetical protein